MTISPYLVAVAVGWVIAQGAKYITAAVKARSLHVFDRLYLSGNMPSAHSATVVSIATLIALRDGVDSGLFGLAVVLALVVMYDAMMVRHSVGEQGAVIKRILKESSIAVKEPHVADGHTPLKVVVGVCIGVLAGIVVFYTTK